MYHKEQELRTITTIPKHNENKVIALEFYGISKLTEIILLLNDFCKTLFSLFISIVDIVRSS
jgi:hypothetical protein